MISSPPFHAVCGPIRTVGSEGSAYVVMRDGDRDVTLLGRRTAELRTYEGRVCVTGSRQHLPPSGDAIVVTRYRLVGDGRHAPIAGTVQRSGERFVLTDDDGHRFLLRGRGLQRLLGRRVFIEARWNAGAFEVRRFGFLGD